MELVRGLHDLRPPQRGSVVTIGNFDGLHLGHQALTARVCALASSLKAVPTVIVFEPHPREFFAPESVPGRVLELRGKLRALAAQGIERVVCLRFDARLAGLSAEAFVRRVLVESLGTRALVVGDDFRFGSGRRGDVELLRAEGREHGFTVAGVDSVAVGGERVSSTRLRAALAEADLEHAARLLGRPYAMCGRVRHGLRLGRKLNMPTANVDLHHPPALRHGVYAVRVRWGGRPAAAGVASLGVRPTLNLKACVLESHLFDPPGDLYGCELETTFVRFLRPQCHFGDLDALARQMQVDAEQARALLAA